MAPSHENGLPGPQARLLHAVCACNYIRLPLTRQHKPSVPEIRFVPSRHFLHIGSICMRRPYPLLKKKPRMNGDKHVEAGRIAKNGNPHYTVSMQYEEKIVEYPPVHPGTDRTFIRFYEGEPDLNSIFYASNNADLPQRIFVTDETICALDSVRPFVHLFHAEDGSKDFKRGFTGIRGKDVLVILGSGEPYKTIDSVLQIVSAALDHNAQRSAVFVGIGGGVITDMTAFAASIFKRGAHCELMPTSLLCMVDASVGGKTGCDFSSYKNMIGSFFPAQKIHICPAFVKSLPQSEYRSGLAEVVKTALLYNPELVTKLENTPSVLTDRTSPLVHEMIQICVSAKARVVEEDLTEKNIRMQLNLGHTFGHALESRAG